MRSSQRVLKKRLADGTVKTYTYARRMMALMAKPHHRPDWPRAMRVPDAAAYVGLSNTTFLREVAPRLKSVPLTCRTVAWLREDLDAWLDQRAGRAAALAEVNPWHI